MDRVEGDSCSSLHTEKRKTIRGKDEGVNLQEKQKYNRSQEQYHIKDSIAIF